MGALTADEIRAMQEDLEAYAFNDRCDLLREAASGSSDPYGGPAPEELAGLRVDVPCAFWLGVGTTSTADSRTIVLERAMLALPLDTEVEETDTVGEIRGPAGDVRSGQARIDSVVRRSTHLELALADAG